MEMKNNKKSVAYVCGMQHMGAFQLLMPLPPKMEMSYGYLRNDGTKVKPDLDMKARLTDLCSK